jgi:chromosome segregation ATPase
MKRLIIGLAVLAIASATGTAARAGDDPAAAVTTDLQQLVSDATALHSAVTADANKITADATALQGTTDAKTARATLQADNQKVQSDRQQLVPPVLADWKQLSSDLAAARSAKTGSASLRSALQQAQQQLKQERQDVATALKAARQAGLALRQSLRKK